MQRILWSLIMISLLSACNLGEIEQGADSEVIITTIPLEVGAVTTVESTQAVPTATVLRPFPTQTAIPTQRVQVQNTQNCTVRADLPTYIVQAGDTLTNIATRSQTTSAQLVDYNCLTNANLISVGMMLHVPNAIVNTSSSSAVSLADTSTNNAVTIADSEPEIMPTQTPALLGIRGTLGMSPVIEAGNPTDWTEYVVEPESTVTINWTGIDPSLYNDVFEVTFFYQPTGTGQYDSIGTDYTVSDGLSITWDLPAGVDGMVFASGRSNNNEFFESSQLRVREPVEMNIQQAPCKISISISGDVYDSPDTSANVVASVLGGEIYIPREAITTEDGDIFYVIYYDEETSDVGYLPQMNGVPFGDCPESHGFNMG